jgi:predicted Zn-dependent protease
LSNAVRNEAVYYQRIQGLTYGDDPRQGFFEGNTFYHPDMRFQLEFPEGWQTQNTPSAVVGVSEKRDAMVQLGLAGEASPRQAAQQFLSQEGVQAGEASTSSVNGNPAATSYFQAQTQQGWSRIVSFVAYGGRTFGLLAYTGQGNLQKYDRTFRDAIGSFQQLRNQDALNVKPNRLEIVKLAGDDAGAVRPAVSLDDPDRGAGDHQPARRAGLADSGRADDEARSWRYRPAGPLREEP